MGIGGFPTRHDYVLAIPQTDIERILAGWIDELPVTTYRGRDVTGFTQDDSGVSLELSDGGSLRGEYLVGCDGGRSLVLVTADGPLRMFALLHDARPVLLDLAGGDGPRHIAPWADPVQAIGATYDGPWERPVPGGVAAPTAVLVRPDGYVAWVGEGTDAGARRRAHDLVRAAGRGVALSRARRRLRVSRTSR
jgi:2-polyprenyl-6-methoxyphenol hydroxylase-like FAD-dependent oxidoreductase